MTRATNKIQEYGTGVMFYKYFKGKIQHRVFKIGQNAQMEAIKYFDLTIPTCSFLHFRNTLTPLQANIVIAKGFMRRSHYFELVIYQLVKKFLPTMEPHSQEVTSGLNPKQNESSPHPYRFEIIII